MHIVKFFGNSRPEESTRRPPSTRARRLGSAIHDTQTSYGLSSQSESSTKPARTPSFSVPDPQIDHEPPPQYVEYAEDSATSEEPLPKKPSDIMVIAVMGPTGSGKSTLISKLAGQNVMVGHNLASCTQDVEEIPCRIGDRNVILVDTPGFNDTVRSDTEILMSLVDWMKESYKEKELSGIIYLHSISDVRMTRSSLQNLRMFRKLCGDDNLQNVILATTKWGITPENDALSREKELCDNNEFWGLMIKDRAIVERFENTKESARYLVEKILQTGKETFTPKIQHEVVEQGKKLSDTDAGAFIDEALIEQAKKHQEEVNALREEQERARRMQDRILQHALEKEGERLERIIKLKEEEQRILRLDEVGALKKRIEDLQTSVAQMKNGEYINRQKFWTTNWKCMICKTKTDRSGRWTCPNCRFAQRNTPWEP